MPWEFGHYKFTRSGEVDITYLNLLFGPQNNFRRNLPVRNRLSLALTLPTSHLREAIGTTFNPYVESEVYRCPWKIDSGGNIRSNQEQIITEAELLRKSLASVRTKIVISQDARDILSDFVRHCRDRDVTVLASWPNIFAHPGYFNNQAVTANLKTIEAFWKNLGVGVIGSPLGAMFQAEFFHDTTYHLNSKGVSIRTAKLIKSLTPWLAKMESRTAN